MEPSRPASGPQAPAGAVDSQLTPIEELIGYKFKNLKLLTEALSHRSYASESRSELYNERLEFLGDSVLAAVVAHHLCESYPDDDEGLLSKKKSLIVSRPHLAQKAAQMNLGAYLFLGVGEESSGGRSRQSLLCNGLEALIGAVYLDGGYHAAARFVTRWCIAEPHEITAHDHKSRLQEVLQKRHRQAPSYEMVHSTGPDHDLTFEASVSLGHKVLGRGSGKSKKEAEQSAAKHALKALEDA